MSFSSNKTAPNNISLTGSQTLSNKTLDSSTIIESGAELQTPEIISPVRLDVKKDSLANLQTYASSASNGQMCFATDSKKMYQVLDSALAEVGSGAGGINYITNSDAEVDLSGWNKYNDGASVIPVDGQGGTDNFQLARSSSSPLRGSNSFLLTKLTLNSQGQGVAVPFVVDNADLAKKLTVKFDYDTNQYAAYTDGLIKVFIIQADDSGYTTNVKVIRVNGEDLMAGKSTHYAQFQTDAVAKYYKLVLHITSSDTNLWSVKFDNVQVGPREVAKGTIVTDWTSYVPTLGLVGSTINVNGRHRRIGDSLEVQISMEFSGTPSSGELSISLPNGLSIDTSKIPAGSQTVNEGNAGFFGSGIWEDSGTGYNSLKIAYKTTTTIMVFDVGTVNATPLQAVQLANGDAVGVSFQVPIQGWSSNAVTSEDLGGREIVVQGAGNGGTSVTANVTNVPFTKTRDTTGSWDGSIFIAHESGEYVFAGMCQFTTAVVTFMSIFVDTGSGFALAKGLGIQPAGAYYDFSNTIYLAKGNKLALRSDISATLVNSLTYHNIHIQKLASPQTILETETVAARYTSDSGQSAINSAIYEYEDLDYDTHNSYNITTGNYVVPVTGKYQVNAIATSTTTVWLAGHIFGISISVNSVNAATGLTYIDSNVTMPVSAQISDVLNLKKGDVLNISCNTNVTTTLGTTSARNTFSIIRIK